MSDTWKFVPVEPTEQMIEAGRHVKRMRLLDSVKAIREGRDPEELMGKTAGAEYRAMLEAAPAPPVPQTVQEIMRLMNPYVAACVKFNNAHRGIIDDALVEAEDAFKPLEAALTALVEKNHELQFALDGVNAMRRPLTDAVDHAHEILRRQGYHRNGDHFVNVNLRGAEAMHVTTIATIVHAAIAAPTHGIEPEQGGNHG